MPLYVPDSGDDVNTYQAASIDEAVALAERFKREGRYDLFRGQRSNWPVVASYARLGEQGRKDADKRLQFFFSWLAQQPDLVELADRHDRDIVDQKIAVAQHYGIPTNFCDFTTEPAVAGFFASAKDAGSQGPSVIICGDSVDLSRYRHPEILRVTVPNLWRLEAQAGVFLFLPFENFEAYYDFDRIVFPAGSYGAVSAQDIYPARRSQLEVHLDQFFEKEKEAARHHSLLAHEPDMRLIALPGAAETMASTLTDGDPGPHASWVDVDPAWTTYRVEPWTSTVGAVQLQISRSLVAPAAEIRDEIRGRLLDFCRAHRDARRVAVVFSTAGEQFPQFVERLQMTWDGVRLFPYCDEDVADAVANTAFLGKAIAEVPKPDHWSPPNAHVAAALWKTPLQVEFGRPGAASANGYVDEPALRSCARPDLLSLLKPEYHHLASDAGNVVNMVPVPSRAFVFEAFARIFATQVVPSQVILFPSRAHYYSPTQLGSFGLP